MKTISPPISITVTGGGGGGSSLGQIAAGMSAGTWAQVTGALNQNAVLGVGGVSGTIMHYAMSCQWNTQNKCIEIVGADHGDVTSMRYCRFDTAANSFVTVNTGSSSTGGTDSGLGPGHEFNGTMVNPATGDVYYRHYCVGTGGGSIGPITVTRAALNGTAFSNAVADSPITVCAVNTGSCWWSGTFTGAGAQGCLVLFNAGASSTPNGSVNDGYMMGLDPLTNTWFLFQQGYAPFYGKQNALSAGGTYHEVMAYSSVKNCAVYGGGNWNPKKVWRLNSDRTFTAMPDVPDGAASVAMQLGIQRGNLVADPVTGNFLLLSSSQLWELNPSGSGTWTQQTGARTPPVNVGSPGPAPGQIDGIQSCSISDYGVIAYIKQTSPTNSSFYLYKHA